MKLDDAVKGVSRLAFDTAPIIYFIETNPAYDKLVSNIFNRVATGEIEGWTSVISLSEVLVRPIPQAELIFRTLIWGFSSRDSNFHTLPINATVAEHAAVVRATYGLRLPDAIQVAFALDNGCQAILCNDQSMRRVAELAVLILDDLDL